MLKINNLHATTLEHKEILKGVDLEIKSGEVTVIMGKNGSGKSTLMNIIAGNPNYIVTQGSITYNGINILELEVHERALMGIFMAFQYPIEIPGVSFLKFLQTAIASHKKYNNLENIAMIELLAKIKATAEDIGLSSDMIYRSVNTGFSGGEKKRAELLQMSLLNPSCMLLDETDSGLDIDALKILAVGFNKIMNEDKIALIVTHYQRLLDYIKADVIHIMQDGKIIKTGNADLVKKLEQHGYKIFAS